MTSARLLGDRYQVGDTLGFGGMSEVHRGRDLRLGRDVAIKVLRADLARDPSFQTRFRREAQNAASLNHPAIVAVYDTGETPSENGSIPYIVMEYVDGQTLRDILKREGAFPAKRAMEIMADVCAALDFSHRHGIVHRDVKPANIMLTKVGAVKVMDFGIARAIADGQATMTATAAVIGTAQYLSPEQARGEAVDARSDVYATGCVLYELLTNTPPFTGDSPVAIAYQHVREDAKPPSEINPNVPKELDAIVLKALNKNPANRYQSAAEMRSDIVRALSGQAVHATPVMSDDERTELLRATPARMPAPAGRASRAPLLAPPSRIAPANEWEDEPPSRTKKVWTYIGIGSLCAAVLAAAVWITINLTNTTPIVPKVQVPEVTNLSQGDATSILIGRNLEVAPTPKFVDSDQDKKDLVIDQDPSAGEFVERGTVITLTIGLGRSTVQVPYVIDDTEESAIAELKSLNFVPKTRSAVSSAAEKGKVIDQSPKGQVEAPFGSEVVLTIGAGPEQTTMLDPATLVGLQLEDAKTLLKNAKLAAIPRSEKSSLPRNQVLRVEGPKAGEEVPVDTVVYVFYSDDTEMTMPNLMNMDVPGAFDQLKLAQWVGESPDIIRQEKLETWQPAQVGRILQQIPESGKVVRKDQQVIVTVGVVPTFTPESFVNVKTVAQAQQYMLEKTQGRAGVIVDRITEVDEPDKDGLIYAQDLPSGVAVSVDTPLRVWAYKYVAPPTTEASTPVTSAEPTETAATTTG